MNAQGYRTMATIRRAVRDHHRRQMRDRGARADAIAHAVLIVFAVFLGACFADWMTGLDLIAQAVRWVR